MYAQAQEVLTQLATGVEITFAFFICYAFVQFSVQKAHLASSSANSEPVEPVQAILTTQPTALTPAAVVVEQPVILSESQPLAKSRLQELREKYGKVLPPKTEFPHILPEDVETKLSHQISSHLEPLMNIQELRRRCTLAGIKWRNAHGKGKHLSKAEIIYALTT